MFNSLIKLLDNTVLELADDVKQGRLRNLGSIGDKAQEKIIFPGALWVAAYSADLDARGRIDRAVRQFKQRRGAWEEARTNAAGADVPRPVVSPALSKAIDTVAAREIETAVRARKFTKPAELSDTEFEQMVSGWLSKNGLDVKLSGPLNTDDVLKAVAEFEGKETRKIAAGKKK
jgi:hypothetical protein